MSAKRIILKRSSIAGKRPTAENLSPGEIGLNTNSTEPGAFFQTTDGRTVKVGPTSYLSYPPTEFPEKGELWFDSEDGTLKVGTAEHEWMSISAPFLGGEGPIVFVAPEFHFSTDSLSNDGQALPFQTVSRAILELSKIYLSRVLSGFSTRDESKRYTIFIFPSQSIANNSPGVSPEEFNLDLSNKVGNDITIPELEQFNPVTGGIVVPFGITLRGIDLKKSVISPSYVPSYSNPFYPTGLQGVDQPLSAIFKCGGNVYAEDFSVVDKLSERVIVGVIDDNDLAVFRSERPHGLRVDDFVTVSYFATVDQSTGTFQPGNYYAVPVDSYHFYLSTGPQTESQAAEYILFQSIPALVNDSNPKFLVTNSLKSAHRLSLFRNASLSEIQEYFVKVQKAFPKVFGGKVTDTPQIVDQGDYVIVGPVGAYPQNEASNTTKNSSFYANQVNMRSEYGMCWGDFDGRLVSGFKSVVANACTAITLQNDPCVYEVYTTLVNPDTNLPEKKWWGLTQAVYLSTPVEQRPASIVDVPVVQQLDVLNTTPINNIRYHYENLKTEAGKSIGIVNTEKDFRHFGFRVQNGAYGQFQSTYCIGAAVGVWALNGGTCSLTNSTTNFGSVAFKAEGFLGINTIGGAKANGKGFVFEGIQRPLAITKSQAENTSNKKILSLGGRITNIYLDESDPNIQIVELSSDFSPCYLLPFSLKPGSALWVESESCTYRGFLATDGGPTIFTGIDSPNFAKIRIRSSDSTIPNNTDLLPVLGVPYVRRFSDPRQDFERSYSICLKNTFQNAISPQIGSVLRLNQTSQQLGSSSLTPNVQFDPGILGGWGRVFTVDAVETGGLGASPQFNYTISDPSQDQTYYVAITGSDMSRPWVQGLNFRNSQGDYVTFENRNWYAAENNIWESLYYGDSSSFTENFGPYSIAPIERCSPFVDTSVLEKQEKVLDTYQGVYAPDDFVGNPEYVGYENGTYFRGSTEPYPTYDTKNVYDDDDSSESMGLCLKDIANGATTSTVSGITVIQTGTAASSTSRYRPEVIEFSVLSSTEIENPRQTVSVVRLSSTEGEEYIRVTNLNGTIVRGIRLNYQNSFYPSTAPGFNWPQLTTVTVCSTNPIAETELYDPDWSNTKRAVYRFFQVMGYSPEIMKPYLTPQYWGERLLSVSVLEGTLPENGYALTTDKWPLEFNQPSAVIANTHTWAYTGYYNYSRGLPEFQTNDFTKKLAADFQATTTWSGRLTVTGINDKGEIVQFGPQRQALTANFYEDTYPTTNVANQQIYEEQPYVEFPAQVVVYSVDDISSLFDGVIDTFDLLRSGLAIPPEQLSVESLFVALGASMQKPVESYTLLNNKIKFASPPPEGTNCNIRVVTSVDSSRTLVTVPLEFQEQFDGSRTTFTAVSSSVDITPLEITSNGTFVFLGGVEQIPVSDVNPSLPFSYSIERTSPTTVQFSFTGPPPAGTTLDVRTICSGSYWSLRGIYPVEVYSLDSIACDFNGANLSFNLTYDGLLVNPNAVTQDNLIVSLGGSIQIPGVSYTVENSILTFLDPVDAPQPGTTINLRVIANAEFISCQDQSVYGSGFLRWGPGLVLTLANDAGLLG